MAVLTLVALIGLASLPRPLAGDQSLFLSYARAIRQGALLYRDVWDAKQPGIYWFYWLNGRLFGFDEMGVHFGELLWFGAFAVVLQRTLGDIGFSARQAALAPLAVIVPYQLLSTTWDLTQLEPLIGFPLYVAFWASVRARGAAPTAPAIPIPDAPRWRWQMLAGLCIAVVTLFKLIYAPLGLCFLVFTLGRTGWRLHLRSAAWWLLGVVIGWAPAALWIARNHLAHDVVYTWFEFPATARAQAAQPLSTLTSNARYFARSIAPIGALALFGVWVRRTRLERWMLVALVWIAVGVALDLTQFWWRYLYWNASVPLGLLAVVGASELAAVARAQPRRTFVPLLIVGVLIVTAVWPQRARLQATLSHPIAIFSESDARAELQAIEQPDLVGLDDTLAFLREPGALAGPIVVFGDPAIQFASGRAQLGRIPGYLANTLGEGEWREMAQQIRVGEPAYVFVGLVQNASEQALLNTRGAEVNAILQASYCEVSSRPEGRWLQRCGPITR